MLSIAALRCTRSDSDGFVLSETKDGSGGPDLEVNAKVSKDVVVREERAQSSNECQLGDLTSSNAEHSGRRKAKRGEGAVRKHAGQEEEGRETCQEERVGRRLRATIKCDQVGYSKGHKNAVDGPEHQGSVEG